MIPRRSTECACGESAGVVRGVGVAMAMAMAMRLGSVSKAAQRSWPVPRIAAPLLVSSPLVFLSFPDLLISFPYLFLISFLFLIFSHFILLSFSDFFSFSDLFSFHSPIFF
jgi:hypothetical protein